MKMDMDQQLITRIVEAALLAANQPLTLPQLRGLLSNGELAIEEVVPDGAIEQALESLQAACADRGVELVEVASGWRFQVKADVHQWVARLWTERKTKYTRATLETLALIAYRQPITRGEIEQVRGVAVSSNIIQALEEREWIRVVGHRDVPGKPALYGTTKGFLDYFGLKRLDELPPLSELKDIGELEPQLQFDDGMPVGNMEMGSVEMGSESISGDSDNTNPEKGAEIDSDPISDGPGAAPGERAAHADDVESDTRAVETTPVPQTDDDTEDDAELASSEQTDE